MSLNPQVEDEKKKPDSIGTGIGKEIKKLNQMLILSKTLSIIIKTDSSRDLDSQTMESLPSRNVTHFPALRFKTRHFPLVKTRALRNIGLDLFRSIEYLRE